MTETKEKIDLTKKIQTALDKATEKVIKDEKARDGYLVVSDAQGNVKKIPAKEL